MISRCFSAHFLCCCRDHDNQIRVGKTSPFASNILIASPHHHRNRQHSQRYTLLFTDQNTISLMEHLRLLGMLRGSQGHTVVTLQFVFTQFSSRIKTGSCSFAVLCPQVCSMIDSSKTQDISFSFPVAPAS